MPIIFSGTDCRLKEKLKIEIEPALRNEASAIMAISAMLLNARPRVRGRDVCATRLTSRQLMELSFKETLGVNPKLLAAKAWIMKWRTAPRATPPARHALPRNG